MSAWKPAPTFPCAGSPRCTAKVHVEGRRCVIHATWSDGPYQYPCVKCKQPIERGDLFRLLDSHDLTSSVHAPCVGNKRRSAKRPTTAPLGF